jgi:hypothetical protein
VVQPLPPAQAEPGAAAALGSVIDAALITAITSSVMAAMQTQLTGIRTHLQGELAAMRAEIVASSASLPPLLPPPPPSLSSSAIPAPHRVGALGAAPDSAAAMAALIDQAINGRRAAEDDGGDDQSEVRTHNTTNTAISASSPSSSPLPAALIPSTTGSAQHNAQVLTELLTTFHKRDAKLANIAALNTALQEWWDLAVAARWSPQQLNSLHQYWHFVVHTLNKWPEARVLTYHKEWVKAVHTKVLDMFSPNSHLHLPALITAELALTAPTTSSYASKAGKKTDTAAVSAKPAKDSAASKVGKHAAGSCTNHPLSTTHTTAECRVK